MAEESVGVKEKEEISPRAKKLIGFVGRYARESERLEKHWQKAIDKLDYHSPKSPIRQELEKGYGETLTECKNDLEFSRKAVKTIGQLDDEVLELFWKPYLEEYIKPEDRIKVGEEIVGVARLFSDGELTLEKDENITVVSGRRNGWVPEATIKASQGEYSLDEDHLSGKITITIHNN